MSEYRDGSLSQIQSLEHQLRMCRSELQESREQVQKQLTETLRVKAILFQREAPRNELLSAMMLVALFATLLAFAAIGTTYVFERGWMSLGAGLIVVCFAILIFAVMAVGRVLRS